MGWPSGPESGAAGTAQVLQNGRWASRCLRRIGRRGQPRVTAQRRTPTHTPSTVPNPHCFSPRASSDPVLEKYLLEASFSEAPPSTKRWSHARGCGEAQGPLNHQGSHALCVLFPWEGAPAPAPASPLWVLSYPWWLVGRFTS